MNSTEKEFAENLSILTDSECYKILCAFSGGVDSLALLILCTEVLGKERVVPLYVNHNLRSNEELEKEIELNRENCKKLGLTLQIKTAENGLIREVSKKLGGTEAAARDFRYGFLEESARESGCSYIATAHHLNDQLETILMKIISKAPISALRGIAERNGNIIRPLLDFRKTDLEAYVESKCFSWATDSTNSDNSIKRNEIRNIIIPQLNTVMPDWEERVLRLRKKAISACMGAFDFHGRIPLNLLRTYSDSQKLMALYSLWDNTIGDTERSMPQTLAERVFSKLDEDFAVVSSNGGTFCNYNGFLYFSDDYSKSGYSDFETEIPDNEGEIRLLDNSVLKFSGNGTKTDLRLDFSRFDGKPRVRYVRQGDVIRLKDGKKTILRLLQDMKIPPVLRYEVPVIEDDEEICAVFGSALGGKDRLCAKMRSALAPFGLYVYFIGRE